MASHFLTKTVVPPGALLHVGDMPAVEQYDGLERALNALSERRASDLFAQPVLGSLGDQGQTIAWYSRRSGTGRRLSELDHDARSLVEATLRERLAAVAPGLRDAGLAPLLGAALQIGHPDDIWVIEGEPVLVNWGTAPPPAATDAAARNRHFQATLGRYLPLDAAPPVSTAEWRARGGAAAQAAGTAVAIQASAMASGSGPARGASQEGFRQAPSAMQAGNATAVDQDTGPVTHPGDRRWRWVPLLALLGVGLVALIWLLLPGTRLFPAPPPPVLVGDAHAERILEEVNRSLEQRLHALREAVNGAVCTPEGALLLPDGRTAEGLAPPATGAAAAPGAPRQGSPNALVPPDPARVDIQRPGADPAAPQETASLLQIIEDQTVLVLALGGDRSGTGSGFFIGPDLVVTNHHVVANAMQGGEVLVTNRKLGTLHRADVMATLGPLEQHGGDFALLRVSGVEMPFYQLRASVETMKLQNVVAAGYPGAILETDANFDRLRAGEASAVPDLAVTTGVVNTEQDLGPATRALIHTAVISPGNSGGPLVDSCGRVVGVNTFSRTANQRHLNFALASTDLLRFLNQSGASTASDAGPCTPNVRPAVPRTAAPANPGTAAPPPQPAQQ